MNLNKEERDFLKKVAILSGEKIESSECFLSLFTKNYKEDPVCALQLGIAILLDKPICLVVQKGEEIPGHLKKIAFAIEYFEDSPSGINDAASRIAKRMKEK